MQQDILYHRLQNCLQTILDLEQSFETLDFEKSPELKNLFSALKDSLSRLDEVHYEPADVERIEQAVALFLQEISLIDCKTVKALYSGRVLH